MSRWIAPFAAGLVAFVIGTATHAADVTEIFIEPDGLRPVAARARLDAPVRFVNRTNSDIHVEFIGEQGEHHVVNVPGRISAVFHRPGRHPYVVHAANTGAELARGVVDVPEDPARNGLPVCGWITVEGICFER
jgi:hypothetical protein